MIWVTGSSHLLGIPHLLGSFSLLRLQVLPVLIPGSRTKLSPLVWMPNPRVELSPLVWMPNPRVELSPLVWMPNPRVELSGLDTQSQGWAISSGLDAGLGSAMPGSSHGAPRSGLALQSTTSSSDIGVAQASGSAPQGWGPFVVPGSQVSLSTGIVDDVPCNPSADQIA